MKAALYTRVSTDEQVEKGFSLDAQKRRLIEFCAKNNYEIYKLYTDEGISGHSIEKRKALQELIGDAKNKKFDCVIVYKTDRLSRNLLDLLTIKKELDSVDVELIMSDESVDTSDDAGMAMFSIMGAFAELERKKISERLMSGKRQKLRTTGIKPKQGVIPYGYLYDDINKKYVVDERYRNDIIKIYSLFEEGKSYNQIAMYMVAANFNFGRNKTKWHASDVTRILRNPIYKGWTGISYYNMIAPSQKIDNEPILIKATNVEPTISEEQWERVNEKTNIKTKYFTRKYPADMFIFAGLLCCSHCGYALSTNQSTERTLAKTGKTIKYFYYECNSRFKLYTNEEKCKGYMLNTNTFNTIFRNFIKNLNNNTIVNQIGLTEINSLIKNRDNILLQIASKNKSRENLLEKLLSGTITDDDYKFMSNKILSDISKLNDELNSINESIKKMDDKITFEKNITEKLAILETLVAGWDILPNEQKRTIIQKCIKKIYVNKNGIDRLEFN
ncbi:MAG: recombinase family protein [Anaeroplasma sp.]